MKKLLLALAMLVAVPVAADGNFGVKAGQLVVDGTASDATQVGLVYTWDFAGMFGAEAELNTSLAKGEAAPGFDYSVNQFAAYGVFMTPGPIYLKAKAGLAYTDFNVDGGGGSSSTDPVYGVGGGFEIFGIVMEVEYAIISADAGDADFISVAIKF
jgi:hypothetical protein